MSANPVPGPRAVVPIPLPSLGPALLLPALPALPVLAVLAAMAAMAGCAAMAGGAGAGGSEAGGSAVGGSAVGGSVAADDVVYTFPPVQPYDRFFADSAAAAALEAGGDVYPARRAVLHVPRGGLTPAHGRALADSLDRVVAGVEAALGGPQPWRRWHRPRVRYYLPDERFISHASRGARVYIPLAMARRGMAPWAHETVHALTAARRDTIYEAAAELDTGAFMKLIDASPFWLWEGLADAIGTDVGEAIGLRHVDIFEGGGSAGIHAACRAWLERDEGRAILPWIGSTGRPPRLPVDRVAVAPPFYTCAHSFTRLLVERHGAPAVAALLAEDDAVAALTRLTGADPATLRARWLDAIGADPLAAAEVAGDGAPALIDRLAWLAGCWELRSGGLLGEEVWMTPRGGSMVGMSRMVRGGETVHHEALRIETRGGRLVYIATPAGQATAEFTAGAVADTVVVFENPAHDFPQRIVYRTRAPDVGRPDSLWARIEGSRGDGPARAAEFAMARVRCPG